MEKFLKDFSPTGFSSKGDSKEIKKIGPEKSVSESSLKLQKMCKKNSRSLENA